MSEMLNAQIDDKLSRLPAAYKQLLHLIARGVKEEEWVMHIRGAKQEHIKAALPVLAEIAGVLSEDREERIAGIQRAGRTFFGIPTYGNQKIASADDFQFPTIEELIVGIRKLPPLQQRKLRAVARSEYGQYDDEARKLGILPGTLKSEIPTLCKEIGFLPLQKKDFVHKRHELLRAAFKQMEELESEPA